MSARYGTKIMFDYDDVEYAVRREVSDREDGRYLVVTLENLEDDRYRWVFEKPLGENEDALSELNEESARIAILLSRFGAGDWFDGFYRRGLRWL